MNAKATSEEEPISLRPLVLPTKLSGLEEELNAGITLETRAWLLRRTDDSRAGRHQKHQMPRELPAAAQIPVQADVGESRRGAAENLADDFHALRKIVSEREAVDPPALRAAPKRVSYLQVRRERAELLLERKREEQSRFLLDETPVRRRAARVDLDLRICRDGHPATLSVEETPLHAEEGVAGTVLVGSVLLPPEDPGD